MAMSHSASDEMLPPHQHPLDWFVIPELKGQQISYLSYTKTGWVCRLCSTDKLVSVDDHCRSIGHLDAQAELEYRRTQLESLVHQRHQQLVAANDAARMEQALAQRRHQEEVEKRRQQELYDKAKEEKFPDQIAAGERRAELRPTGEEQTNKMRMEDVRERERERAFEELWETGDAPTEQATRSLRTQRLKPKEEEVAGPAARLPSSLQAKLKQKQAEKEAKRLQVLEITKKHQEKQKMEEAQMKKATKLRRRRKGDNTSNEDMKETEAGCGLDTYGCMPNSLWESGLGLLTDKSISLVSGVVTDSIMNPFPMMDEAEHDKI